MWSNHYKHSPFLPPISQKGDITLKRITETPSGNPPFQIWNINAVNASNRKHNKSVKIQRESSMNWPPPEIQIGCFRQNQGGDWPRFSHSEKVVYPMTQVIPTIFAPTFIISIRCLHQHGRISSSRGCKHKHNIIQQFYSWRDGVHPPTKNEMDWLLWDQPYLFGLNE